MNSTITQKVARYAFATVFGGVFLFCLSLFSIQLFQWHSLKPEQAISPGAWNFSYNYGDSTPPEMLWLKGNPRLPQSKRAPFDQKEESFWIGTVITPSMLLSAKKLEADHLHLGWVNGGYELWLDNVQVLASDLPGDQIVLDVKDRLNANFPLKVALKVKNSELRSRPDNLSHFYGRELGEGFFSARSWEQYEKLLGFTRNVRPTILSLANAILSLFFFFLWLAAPMKRELFSMAVYTLVGAAFQLLLVNGLSAGLRYEPAAFLNTVLVYWEGLAALIVSYSFARKYRYEAYLWSMALLAPLLGIYFYHNHPAQYFISRIFHNWINPACYIIGAAICAREWLIVKDRVRSRAKRLFGFSATLLGIGMVNLFDGFFWSSLPFLENVLLLNFFNFALVLFLAAIEITEYKHERRLLQKTPISPYHRHSVLLDRVAGVMLTVDLKNSESLFRLETNEEGIMGSCLSILWNAVLEFGGITLSTEGDSLVAFFDAANIANPLSGATMSLLKMNRDIALFETQLRERSAIPELVSIRFRASVVAGAIKPIWHDQGEVKIPSWSDAAGSLCFLESARLLEIEKSLAETKDSNGILVASGIAEQMSSMHLELVLANTSRPGKHGKEYHFSVFRPRRIEHTMPLKVAA